MQTKFWKGLLLILGNSQETLMKGRPENENPEWRRELAQGHWDKSHFLGHAVGTSHSDHGRVSDKLSSDCFEDKIETGGIRKVQGMES